MKSLAFYTKHSLALHVLVVFLFVVLGKILSWQMQERKRFQLKLVENSVRVDVVRMPKKTLQELKKLPLIEQKTEDTVPVTKAKDMGRQHIDNKNNLTALLKGLSKGKIEKASKGRVKERKSLGSTRKLRSLVLAGNKLSQGQSSFGNETAHVKAYESYLESVANRVKQNWSLPGYFVSKDLQCRIRIYLNKTGKLLQAKIFESSGNEEFDKAAIDAVKMTRYPAPDASFANDVLKGQIILGFPL